MKRIISLIFIMFILCSCEITRDRYYTFYFDDYNITPGYDNMEYMRLVFKDDLKDELKKNECIENVNVYFWDKYFANIDVKNYYSRTIESNKAVVTRFDFYFDNEANRVYRINDYILTMNIAEDCKAFNGSIFDNNGHGCVFGQRINNQNNTVVLYGDYFNVDENKLHRIEIYVE